MSSNQRISGSFGRGSNRVTVNGVSYDLPPGSVSIVNGVITVNGKRLDVGDERVAGVVEVRIEGNPLSVESDASVTVNGNVQGDVRAGGSVTCGDVGGSASAGGSVTAKKLGGNASAGGSVRIGS